MKSIKKFVACFALLATLSLPAQATDALVLTFEDLATSTYLSQYEGFGWTNFLTLSSQYLPDSPYDSGYRRMYEHSGMAILNSRANDASVTRTDGGLFDFDSADLIAGWNDGLNVTVEGWLGDAVQYTKTVILDSTAPSAVSFDFAGIDKLTFSSFGGEKNPLYTRGAGTHFAIDNMSFVITTAVPEPSTYAMLLAGLTMVGFVVRKRGTTS